MNKINFSIITPEKIIFSGIIDMATIPGSEGEFAILPGHIAMIAMLDIGKVNIYENNMITQTFYVSNGFLENDGTHCKILTRNCKHIQI